MQTKFKSGLNLFYVLFLSVFQIVILLLLTSPIFADSKVGLRFGVLLFIIDAVLILPMLFFTKYEIGENELIIQDWPLRRYKIPYGDIISVEDGDFEAKNKKTVALSMKRIAVGYRKESVDKNGKTRSEEIYIYISPADLDTFLLRLSGKMQIGEEQAKEKAAQLAKKQEEHLKKKKQWQKEKARRKAENAPEVIQVSGNVKFSEFTETDEKAVNDEMSADDEKPVEEAQEKISESEDTKN